MTMSDEVWQCSAGETFDLVALAVYGDEKYASEIMCANPSMGTKIQFEGGEELNLPVIVVPKTTPGEGSVSAYKAPWKE